MLKTFRKKHNLTQVQLAKLLGVCRETVQNIEYGQVTEKKMRVVKLQINDLEKSLKK